MQTQPATPSKPTSELWRPELIRLVRLTPGRLLIRRVLRALARLLVLLFTRLTVRGMENFPSSGPALLVGNHLGDADVILALAVFPQFVEVIGKIELYDIPIVGFLMHVYGAIWVHRGRPDRRALACALEALRQGRILALAPEGRESLSGGLEQGAGGAAFLALKADAPVIPVTVTGSGNARLYGNLSRLRRTTVAVTVGQPFRLTKPADRRQAIAQGTRQIMAALARQLPVEYRGVYKDVVGKINSRL